MQVPNVVDLDSLHHFPDILKKVDLHKLQSELLMCLPSMPDLHRLRDGISNWHIKELLYNCLPVSFSTGNQTDVCVLVITLQLTTSPTPLFSPLLLGERQCCVKLALSMIYQHGLFSLFLFLWISISNTDR